MITRSKNKRSQQKITLHQQICKNHSFDQHQEGEQVKNKQVMLDDDESQEYSMMYQDGDLNIQGMKYKDIQQNYQLKSYLQRLKSNLPSYSNLSSQQKVFYFKKLSHEYDKNINQKNQVYFNSKPKKQISFQTTERYVAFDKNLSANHVKFLEQVHQNTKF